MKNRLMSPHTQTYFELQKYCQAEPNFNGVYSRNSSPKTKDGAYVANLDEFKSIGTHWVALYGNGNNVTCFDNFWIKHVSKEIKKFIEKKSHQIFIGYKQTSKYYVDTLVLNLLILC